MYCARACDQQTHTHTHTHVCVCICIVYVLCACVWPNIQFFANYMSTHVHIQECRYLNKQGFVSYSDFHNDCPFFSTKKKLYWYRTLRTKTEAVGFGSGMWTWVFFIEKKKDCHYGNQSTDYPYKKHWWDIHEIFKQARICFLRIILCHFDHSYKNIISPIHISTRMYVCIYVCVCMHNTSSMHVCIHTDTQIYHIRVCAYLHLEYNIAHIISPII